MRRRLTPPSERGELHGFFYNLRREVMVSFCELREGLGRQGSFSRESWGRSENVGKGQRASLSRAAYSQREN